MRFSEFLSDFLAAAPKDEKGNIVLKGSAITPAARRLDVEELAIFSTIDLISAAASLCEWRTYQGNKRTCGMDWYRFNLEPNPNQNAAEFKRLLFARLLRWNEALVIQRADGSYYLAESFTREQYAFKPNVYSNITFGGLTLSRALEEDDVLYFRLANQDAAGLIRNLNGLYSAAMQEALEKYKKSGGKSGILEISATASGSKTFETDLETLMNDRFKRFFESKNAVLPLTNGYHYVPQEGSSTQKAANEVADLRSLMEQAQDRACNAYHVPPALQRGDVTNQNEAVKSLLSFGVKPPIAVVETEVNRKVYGRKALEGWGIRIDTTHIRTVDVFDVAEKAEKLMQNRLYNPNGIREKLGDEPINEEWADQYAMTKNAETVPT